MLPGPRSINTPSCPGFNHPPLGHSRPYKLWFLLQAEAPIPSKVAETPKDCFSPRPSAAVVHSPSVGIWKRGCYSPANCKGRKDFAVTHYLHYPWTFLTEGAPWASERASPMEGSIRMTVLACTWAFRPVQDNPHPSQSPEKSLDHTHQLRHPGGHLQSPFKSLPLEVVPSGSQTTDVMDRYKAKKGNGEGEGETLDNVFSCQRHSKKQNQQSPPLNII